MLRLLKVQGSSLSPSYQDGDFVLTLKIPFRFVPIKKGDIVVFHHPIYETMIKRVERVSADGREIFVVGTHPESTDSRNFGPILQEDLVGKVFMHIRRPGRSQKLSP
jgi:signal peptidase I